MPTKPTEKNTETGHGTTIIEGFAVGYESAVWTTIILCAAIFASVLIYTTMMSEVNPIFIAYGVVM
jgi:K(+)-stimulated pyrophosphate-energized sodium pump